LRNTVPLVETLLGCGTGAAHGALRRETEGNMNLVNARSRWGLAAATLLAVVAVGCSSLPPGSYPAGDYPVDVVLPAQSIGFDGATCSVSVDVAETPVSGATATVPEFEIAEGQTSLTLDNVALHIPEGTVALGTGTLACEGVEPEVVNFSITFAATITAMTGTLDVAAKEVSLDESTVVLTGAMLDVDGVAALPLPPVKLSVATFVIDF
jgi:hypothetical protein